MSVVFAFRGPILVTSTIIQAAYEPPSVWPENVRVRLVVPTCSLLEAVRTAVRKD